MTDGIWKLTEDGEFVLDEAYASELKEARVKAAMAWTNAIVDHLADKCPYTKEELLQSLLQRCGESEAPNEIVNEFVLEALSGDL